MLFTVCVCIRHLSVYGVYRYRYLMYIDVRVVVGGERCGIHNVNVCVLIANLFKYTQQRLK